MLGKMPGTMTNNSCLHITHNYYCRSTGVNFTKTHLISAIFNLQAADYHARSLEEKVIQSAETDPSGLKNRSISTGRRRQAFAPSPGMNREI